MTVVAVGVVVALLVGGGVAYLITSGPGPVPRISPAARSLLRSSLAAARAKGSFHYVSRFTQQGVTQTTIGDAGETSGRQVITLGPETFTVLVVGPACYIEGNAGALADQLGLPSTVAAGHAGQWISLAPADVPYQSVYAAVTTRSALADNIDIAPHRRLGPTVQGGRRVIGVTGPMTDISVGGQTQKAKGTAYLYMTASGHHLPVLYSERGTVGGHRTVAAITFSDWGAPVVVTAPAGAVPFSSLGPVTVPTPTGNPSLVSA
jgi:hypothetical protein